MGVALRVGLVGPLLPGDGISAGSSTCSPNVQDAERGVGGDIAVAPTACRSGHLGRLQRYPKPIQVYRVGILVPNSAQVLDEVLLAGLPEG